MDNGLKIFTEFVTTYLGDEHEIQTATQDEYGVASGEKFVKVPNLGDFKVFKGREGIEKLVTGDYLLVVNSEIDEDDLEMVYSFNEGEISKEDIISDYTKIEFYYRNVKEGIDVNAEIVIDEYYDSAPTTDQIRNDLGDEVYGWFFE